MSVQNKAQFKRKEQLKIKLSTGHFVSGRKSHIALACALSCMLGSISTMTQADTLIYDGNASMLQEAPDWFDISTQAKYLFPGTTAATLGSDNVVRIDFSSGAAPEAVFGRLNFGAGHVEANNNKVIVNNGSILSEINGGRTGSDDNYLNGPSSAANNNVVEVNGGTLVVEPIIIHV